MCIREGKGRNIGRNYYRKCQLKTKKCTDVHGKGEEGEVEEEKEGGGGGRRR